MTSTITLAVIRIAETFNVAVDYLVIEDAARRPLHAPENALADQLADFAQLIPTTKAPYSESSTP